MYQLIGLLLLWVASSAAVLPASAVKPASISHSGTVKVVTGPTAGTDLPAYPAGSCMRCASKDIKPTCKHGKCGSTSKCNALDWPAIAPYYPGDTTHGRCTPDARVNCSAAGMWECAVCHSWVLMQADCGRKGKPRGVQDCEMLKAYTVMRQAPKAGHIKRCVSVDRWLVLPNIPCTGIEDPHPDCTGYAGEVLWKHAYEEALYRGFPAVGDDADAEDADDFDDDMQRASSQPSWMMLMASPAARAHQQMHVHIGRIVHARKNMPLAYAIRNKDLDESRYARRGCISTDLRAPSVRHILVNASCGNVKATTPVVLISVFLPAKSAGDIPSKVRPFETARTIAAAVPEAEGVPYVLMLLPHSQSRYKCVSHALDVSIQNRRSRARDAGFAVLVMLGGSQASCRVLQQVPTDDCYKYCPLPHMLLST